MRKLQLKLWLFTLLLTVGGVNSAWAQTVLYERGTTNAWSSSDVGEGAWSNGTIGTNGLEVTNGVASSIAISPTSDKSTLTWTATWNPGNATGTENKTNAYIQFGDVKFAFYGSSWRTDVTIGSTTTALSGGGTTRGRDYIITVTINQATNEVSYTFNDNGTEIKGAGTTASAGLFSTLTHGLGGKSPSWTNTSTLKKVEITEIENTSSYADYTVKYMCGGAEIKSAVVRTSEVGSTVTLLDTDKETFYSNDLSLKYVYASDNATGQVIAEDGSTVITIQFTSYGKIDYNVKAVDSEGNTLATSIASVTGYSDTALEVWWSKYIKVGDTWYVANSPFYQNGITENGEKSITYTVSDIDYFIECENMNGVRTDRWVLETNAANSGYRKIRQNSYYRTIYTDAIAEGGPYNLALPYNNSNSSNVTHKIQTRASNGDVTDVTEWTTESGSKTYTLDNINIPDGHSIAIYYGGDGNSNARMDYLTLTKSSVNYTVKYMCGETEIKDAVIRTAKWGTAVSSLIEEDKASIVANEKKYVYSSDDSEDVTVAADGSTVVTINFTEVNKVNYTVKAMAGETELATIIEGSNYPGEAISYGYSQYLAKDGILYKSTKQGSNPWWGKSFTLGEENYAGTISYTAEGSEGIVFCSEAEDIDGLTVVSGGNTDIRASNRKGAYAASETTITTLPAGKYKIMGATYGNAGTTFTIKAGDETVFTIATNGNPVHTEGDEFTLSTSTDIVIPVSGNGGNSPKVLDYIIIQKTGEYVEPATANYHVYKEGVEVAAGTDYFLYNLGAKKFLDNGMDWGTHATVDKSGRKITFAALNDGKYSIYTETYSLNNSAVAKSGYMTTNGYCDTGTNDANWEFTPVSVDGYTNVYTIKNSDTQYLIYNSEDARVNVGESTNDNNSYWIIVPKSARDAVNDVTYLLMNTDFNRPWERAVWSGSTGTNDKFTTGGAASNRCGEKYHAVFDLYQNIAATPANGKYVLHAQGFYRLDGGSDPAYLYINDDKVALKVFNGEGEGTVANMDGASASFSAGLYKSEVTSIVTNNTMRVGIKNDNAENWLIWDNFYLEYLGTTLINDAVALPEGGAMEAGKWYYIDIAAAANNYVATATTLSDIIYTTDGTMLTADAAGVTNHFTAEDNTLTAGRHYVMSTTANSLEISIPSFTYTVGTAVASQNYIQTGNVVTVTYADLATNNPDVKEATIDFSGVTFGGNAQAVTPTANGFTFTVPAVTANTEYTLAIPAGAIGYAEGDTYNEAQNIVVKTPALLDGTYFLKVENETAAKGKYLARGRSRGTHATVDKYGLPIVITTNSDNVSTLMASDTRRFYYHGDSWDCWADNTNGSADVAKFTITLADGKYRIHSNAMADGTYLKYNDTNVNDENIPVYDDGTGSNSGPIIDWSVELPAEHATVMQAMKDAQAATAAAAAYASGDYESLKDITTVAALEAELTSNYIKGDFVAPSPIESISEKYQGGQPGSENTMETVYSNSIEITKAGFYKFSMQAFYRAASNDVTQAMHTAGVDFPPVFLFFGDAQTQIKSVYDDGGIAQDEFETETVGGAPVEYNGKYYTNGQHNSVIVFQKDYYHNDVWVYISEPGTYNYGVKYTGWANAIQQWFIYSPESVTITSYAAAATDDDYTAMNSAIENAKAKTLGFDENEYAPYNNIANIEAIATAEAINQEATNSQLLIRSLTETLNNWTKNNADVDAIFNGNMAIANGNNPKGWTRSNNAWGQQITGLGEATSNGTAWYYNTDGAWVYGNDGSYTMPLKGNTVYKLLFKYRSQDNNTNNWFKASIVNAGGESIFETTYPKATEKNWVSVEKIFSLPADGNYVLHLYNSGNTYLSDVSLVKAEAESITINETETYAVSTTTERYGNVTFNRTLVEGWNGLVLPFDMTVENVATTFKASKVKNFTGITYDEAKGVTLNFDNFAAETVIPAGTPFLVKADAAGSSYTIDNVVLPATGLQNITKTADGNDKIKYTMKGTHAASTDLTKVSFALIQGNTFFYHDGAAAKASSAKAFRAYFENESEEPAAARVSFDFGDGETTGITELAQPKTAADGTYYDLQGRKVENFKQKGIYIVNGRKVVK